MKNLPKETKNLMVSFLLLYGGITFIAIGTHYDLNIENDIMSLFCLTVSAILILLYEYHNFKLRTKSKGESNEDNEDRESK